MKRANVYAVILAGGSGTRFWPLSRQKSPKQFIGMVDERSLLQQTLERITPLVDPANMVIVTGERYRTQVRADVKKSGLSVGDFMFEPSGKNTAPAICWAAARIALKDPEAVILVLPSDHLIQKKKRFIQVLRRAVERAQAGHLVTMGISPTRPETGYGYLRLRKGKEGLSVSKFTEKPDRKTAERFLKNGYLWNSGMFAWRADVILNEFKTHLPRIYAPFKKAGRGSVKSFWSSLQSISIDYGILEKAESVAAVEAQDIGWSDLGSWSLTEIVSTDKSGNTLRGDVINVNSRNTFVHTDKRLIAAVGLENIVIVDTPDALLVCQRDQSQDVKSVVEELKRKKRKEV